MLHCTTSQSIVDGSHLTDATNIEPSPKMLQRRQDAPSPSPTRSFEMADAVQSVIAEAVVITADESVTVAVTKTDAVVSADENLTGMAETETVDEMMHAVVTDTPTEVVVDDKTTAVTPIAEVSVAKKILIFVFVVNILNIYYTAVVDLMLHRSPIIDNW